MKVMFSESFVSSLQKHSAIMKDVRKKVDMICKHPVALGEPLKGNLRGFYSCPVKRNFLVIFLYCALCRKKGDDAVVLCSDCKECSDETIRFAALGPHNSVYGKE